MANRFVAIGTGSSNLGSTSIDTRDGGDSTAIVEDDLLVLFVGDDVGDGTVGVPVGFTLRLTNTQAGPDSHRFQIYTKTAGASEPDTYTLTTNSSFSNISAVLVVDDDLDETARVLGTWDEETSSQSGSTTISFNGITVSADDTIYSFAGTDDTSIQTSSATPPSGYTELADTQGASQWDHLFVSELDGATAGATGALTQTATIGSGAGWSSVLIAFSPAGGGGGGDTITPTDFANHDGFQMTSDEADIVFSGTNTGATPDNVQVQLYESDGTTVSQAWTELSSATITSTTFTGTLTVPKLEGKYRFAVRSRDVSNVVLATSTVTTNLWGVGHKLVFAGDSDVFRITSSDSATGLTPSAAISQFDYTTETWGAGSSDGIGTTIANTLSSDQGCWVGVVEAAKSGGLAEQFGTAATTDYNKLDSITSAVGECAWALVNHGANDATGGLSNLTTYKGWLTTIETLLRTNCGASLPIYYLTISRFDPADGGTGSLDNAFSIARQGQKEVAAANANSHYVISGLDVAMSAFHYTSAGYQNDIEPRISRAIDFELGTGTYFRGPQITALSISGTVGTATVVNNGTSLTIDTNNGLSATDDNGALSISSVTSPDANTLTITFGATPVGTVELSYGLGEAPHAAGEGINDNTTDTLPLEPLFSLEGVAAGSNLVAQHRSVFRGIFSRIHGRIN